MKQEGMREEGRGGGGGGGGREAKKPVFPQNKWLEGGKNSQIKAEREEEEEKGCGERIKKRGWYVPLTMCFAAVRRTEKKGDKKKRYFFLRGLQKQNKKREGNDF